MSDFITITLPRHQALALTERADALELLAQRAQNDRLNWLGVANLFRPEHTTGGSSLDRANAAQALALIEAAVHADRVSRSPMPRPSWMR